MRPRIVLIPLMMAAPLVAQEPEPESAEPLSVEGQPRSVQVGLYGFGARIGADFEEGGQAVASFSLDLGHVYTDRLRIRPSGELGWLSGPNSYVVSAELVYRFTPNTNVAVPYVGGGLGLAGSSDCSTDPGCPSIWLQFVLGFELRFRDQISWLLEYHAEDAVRRHRVFVGLTTRPGV